MNMFPGRHDGGLGRGARIAAWCGAGLLALTLLPACWPAEAVAGAICPDTEDVQLTAGKSIDAGDVKVCNDDITLTITYEATFPWCLLTTNLHVAAIPGPPAEQNDDNIPQSKKGTPKVDQFDYGEVHDCVGTATFDIPLDDIDGGGIPGDTVVIAAHAEVDDGERVEAAWGEGPRFVERGSRAMYFSYEVEEPFLCGGETSKCVFLTSTTHFGDLGGLAGADQICQDLAQAPGSLAAPGTYKAWLSTSAAWPADGSRFTQAAVPYKLVDGTVVAADWADLTDGALEAEINLTEGGATPLDVRVVWTGTLVNGTHSGHDCNGWSTGTNEAFGMAGRVPTLDGPHNWTQFSGLQCGSFFGQPSNSSLYCFQQ